MIKKSIQMLKNNSILVLFYVIYMIVTYLIMFSLYPKNLSMYTNPATFNVTGYFDMMGKMFAAIILIFIFGLLFFSGYGNMISEAALRGKTSAASFITGIQKFFVRVLLAALLLIAFSIGYTIILSILLVITMFVLTFNIYLIQIVSMIISFLSILFIIPFVLLWFPSIFIDDAGVMQGLKNGAKAGSKNYWKVILLIIVIYLPIVPTMMFNYKDMTNGNIFTPGYLIMYVFSAIISIVIVPVLFIMYQEYKNRSTNIIYNDNSNSIY